MEAVLNFAWLALSLSMVIAWSAGPYSPVRTGRVEWGRQAVALSILLLVLLPVVSLTDDLQAWTSPAEVEHGLRRADSTTDNTLPAESPGLWIHAFLTSLTPIRSLTGKIGSAYKFRKPQIVFSHPLESRPPPPSA